jgi:hypothetical protein
MVNRGIPARSLEVGQMMKLVVALALAATMLVAVWGTALAGPPSQDAPPNRQAICDHIGNHSRAEITPRACP